MTQQMGGQGMSAHQKAYQMQIQAQARQLQQAAAQNRPGSSGMGHPGAMPNAVPNPAMAGMQPGLNKATPENFIRQVQSFMAQRGQSVDLNPVLFGRPVNPMQLYGIVLKMGGSAKISKANQWPFIAQQLQFPPMQQAGAAAELQRYWMQNLAPYEMAWLASKQQQQPVPPQQHGAPKPDHMRMGSQGQPATHMSPVKSMPMAGQEPNHQFPQGPQPVQNGMKPMNNNMSHPQTDNLQNGVPTKPETRQPSTSSQNRMSLSRQGDPTQSNGQTENYAMLSPAKRLDTGAGKDMTAIQTPATMPPKEPIEDPFKPTVISESPFHGPINVQEIYPIADAILNSKPVAPEYRELGVIDLHALNMAIKSGIHAEVRVALDALTVVSCEGHLQLSLENCDDLVETLIDCAQDQLDFLVEHATEVCDEIDLLSYEDVVRGCRSETDTMQDVPEFASVEYDLDRAADRLICITTLLRNFSFYEANFNALGMTEVIKFMTTVIRYLGTRNMLLRNHRNTLDFMKDVVIYLSNLSTSIQLPGKEEALYFLHFLLTFAPSPSPVTTTSDKVFFTTYNPQIHKYMPSAVDSLAKLLARDDPNRTFYKSIFAADAISNPPYTLLSRAFGLAIAPIPESHKGNLIAMVEARKPFILQGMLAAEILANLAPGSESKLARSWLESTDGFAISLLRLICMLSTNKVATQVAQRMPQAARIGAEHDAMAYNAITHRGLAVLRRLAEKSRSGDSDDSKIPTNVLPKKESLLGALVTPDIDPFVVRQLCIYSGMED
ncbi:putative arid bright domain protein [Phaeomoniella chlamydospora]|uniref:Putative arid bright domain protein n=1 Tax=Phaeomoniella chlamydospora TaxID=158046 RepID=A0A0G2F303_PHACM|nr:putative arid bright domain protein [Phaeomoniella chlamydospora]